MILNRRNMLAGLPVAGVAVAAPAIAKPLSAEERMTFHLAEFKRAAEEIDPTINRWEGGAFGRSAHESMPLALYARRYEPWELAALKGATPDTVNALRVAAGMEPFPERKRET